MKLTFLFILFTFLFSIEPKDFQYDHISLIIHEELINDFFSNIGEIKGSGEAAYIDYSWYLLNPRVEIENDDAFFFAEVRAITNNFRITRDVKGKVIVTYDEESNIIEVKIDKANVILDVDVFGKNFVLTEIDIGGYFKKTLKLNGPSSLNNEINYQLPNGESKIMIVNKAYNLKLVKDAIKLSTTLQFELKE